MLGRCIHTLREAFWGFSGGRWLLAAVNVQLRFCSKQVSERKICEGYFYSILVELWRHQRSQKARDRERRRALKSEIQHHV